MNNRKIRLVPQSSTGMELVKVFSINYIIIKTEKGKASKVWMYACGSSVS